MTDALTLLFEAGKKQIPQRNKRSPLRYLLCQEPNPYLIMFPSGLMVTMCSQHLAMIRLVACKSSFNQPFLNHPLYLIVDGLLLWTGGVA